MTDPMDIPPADHGSDRFDYIEIEGPELPSGPWYEALVARPCPDCRPNIFLKWSPAPDLSPAWPSQPFGWHVTIAHDETCPSFGRTDVTYD